MKNKKVVLASLVTALIASTPVIADWSKAASLLGGDNNKTTQNGAIESQNAFLAQFVSSSKTITDAQLLAAKSLNLDEMAAKIEAERKAKDGQSIEQLKTAKETGSNLNSAIEKAMKDGVKLDADSKKLYLEALVQYSVGLVQTKSVVDSAPGFLSSAKDTISSASMTEKLSVTGKLEDGMYVAKEIPAYAKSLWDTSNLMISFAKSNDIEVPADATKALSGMSFN